MIAALLLGRKNSQGLKDKNVTPILGRPLTLYPLLAAKQSRAIDKIYLSTDSDAIREVCAPYGVETIERPAELASNTALLEDAIVHGFKEITKRNGKEPEIIVLLLSNAATVPLGGIDEGIGLLKARPELDSVASVSQWNQYTPVRARVIGSDGLIANYLPDSMMEDVSCDRNTSGDIYFVDASLCICRPRCMDLEKGIKPFRWLGRRIHPIRQKGGLDVDDAPGLAMTEQWLKAHGFSETKTPYDP